MEEAWKMHQPLFDFEAKMENRITAKSNFYAITY